MLRDCESWRMSSNINDYVSYGRMLNNNNSAVTAGGPFGDPYHAMSGTGTVYRRAIPGGPFSTLFLGARLYVGSNISGLFTISAFDLVNDVAHVSVQFSAAGVISVINAAGVLLATGAGQFPLNAWFYSEIKFVVGTGTAGAVIVRINGNVLVNLTGVNTQNGSRAVFDTTSFAIAYSEVAGIQHPIWYDATGSYNNNFLGDRRVIGELPNSAGDTTQFTPVGAAANWQNAANAPPAGDSDYNVSGTVGNTDLYKASLPSGVTAIAGVMVSAITRKDDSGSRSFATLLKSGGTLVAGASVPQAASYTTQSDVFETDPSTSVPFIPSALANLQFGGKVAA